MRFITIFDIKGNTGRNKMLQCILKLKIYYSIFDNIDIDFFNIRT